MTGLSRSMPISRSYSIFLVLVSCLLLITFAHSEAFVPRRKTSYKDFWESVQLNYTKKNLKADSKKNRGSENTQIIQKQRNPFLSPILLHSPLQICSIYLLMIHHVSDVFNVKLVLSFTSLKNGLEKYIILNRHNRNIHTQ